jgi:teichuronic acid biosynthesis glycosyltransferase TuaG
MLVPHFSVITPVLNGLRDIPGYVKALQSQSCRDWEAIVVDDGSSDGGLELLQRLTTGDTRFRLTRNTLPRQIPGPYQARNVGLSLARGKFVCFLDIDDRWLPHKLESQNTRLKHNPEIKLLYSAYIRARRGAASGRIRRAPPMLPPHAWIHIANPVPMLTACVQREAIAGLHFVAQHHEDYLFWHAVLQRLQPSQIADDRAPLAIYCIHTASISSNKLQATGWIWQCYRRIGHRRPVAAAAMLARGLLQAWLAWRETTTPPIQLYDATR